ncbi:hypothetical protein Tco_0809848 [Tanacetum coccineum]
MGKVLTLKTRMRLPFGRKRLCILTKHPECHFDLIIIVKGKVYYGCANRAILLGRLLFESIMELDYSFGDESVQGAISADPFGLNDLLGLKKPVEENLEPSPSLSHPPGFSPVGSLNSSDKELNKEFSPTISAKGFGSKVKIGVVEHGPIDSLIFRRQDLMSNLNDLKEMEDMDFVQKAKVRWAIKGDENSKYFHGIINKKRSNLAIRGVFVDGTWGTDPILVKKAHKGQYETQFLLSESVIYRSGCRLRASCVL